jgi:hypothetical protein
MSTSRACCRLSVEPALCGGGAIMVHLSPLSHGDTGRPQRPGVSTTCRTRFYHRPDVTEATTAGSDPSASRRTDLAVQLRALRAPAALWDPRTDDEHRGTACPCGR